MSHFLLAADARKAIKIVRPMISQAMKDGTFKRDHLHIIVVDPAILYQDGLSLPILHEESWQRARWELDHREIAHKEARLSWKYRQATDILQATQRHLLEGIDTLFAGSVCDDGIVVGVSGVEPWYDLMVARCVAAACKAIAINNYERAMASATAATTSPWDRPLVAQDLDTGE